MTVTLTPIKWTMVVTSPPTFRTKLSCWVEQRHMAASLQSLVIFISPMTPFRASPSTNAKILHMNLANDKMLCEHQKKNESVTLDTHQRKERIQWLWWHWQTRHPLAPTPKGCQVCHVDGNQMPWKSSPSVQDMGQQCWRRRSPMLWRWHMC